MITTISIYPNNLNYIFAEDHQGINLNLGGDLKGNIIYDENEGQLQYKIATEANIEFVDNLYGEVQLVSAIVGKNGTGKSTILKYIRDEDLIILTESGTEMSLSKDYLKIYYSPYLSYDDEGTYETNVINLSKFSQMKIDLRRDSVDITTMINIHNSEFLKRVIQLSLDEKIYNHLLNLGLPQINFIKINLLKFNEDDWNISRNFVRFFKELEKIKEQERSDREQIIIDRLNLNDGDPIENYEYREKSYKIRLELDIINSIISKVKRLLEVTGNKYLQEGFVQGEFEVFQQMKSYRDAFYWLIENAYVQLTKNSQKIFLPYAEIKEFTDSLLNTIEGQQNFSSWTEFYVDKQDAVILISNFENLLFSFERDFAYDDNPILRFSTDIKLSSGEKAMYDIFSLMYDVKNKISKDILEFKDLTKYLILLDEGDMGFHPTWKKKYINLLVEILPKIFENKELQLIITTHDPLTLSDIPTSNIIFLGKDTDGKTIIVNKEDKNTFGANISDLFADSFFVEGGLMGDFAKRIIEEIIEWINSNKQTKKKTGDFNIKLSRYKKIIEIIDERILKVKLSEMISELEDNNEFNKKIIKKEIEVLNRKLDKL